MLLRRFVEGKSCLHCMGAGWRKVFYGGLENEPIDELCIWCQGTGLRDIKEEITNDSAKKEIE